MIWVTDMETAVFSPQEIWLNRTPKFVNSGGTMHWLLGGDGKVEILFKFDTTDPEDRHIEFNHIGVDDVGVQERD